jgi:Methyltransferase domain
MSLTKLDRRKSKISRKSDFAVVIAFGILTLLLTSSRTLKSALPAFTEDADAAPVFALSSSVSSNSFELAYRDSNGFFDDVPEHKWLIRKRIASERILVADEIVPDSPQEFHQNNWNPNFSCEFEDFLGPGGDGGKWVCDPHRISKTDCIVYSIG